MAQINRFKLFSLLFITRFAILSLGLVCVLHTKSHIELSILLFINLSLQHSCHSHRRSLTRKHRTITSSANTAKAATSRTNYHFEQRCCCDPSSSDRLQLCQSTINRGISSGRDQQQQQQSGDDEGNQGRQRIRPTNHT